MNKLFIIFGEFFYFIFVIYMGQNQLIPNPLLFNCWKHHLIFIKEQLCDFEIKSEKDIKEIVKEFNVIGNSLTDLYTGLLSTEKIAEAVIKFLKENSCYEEPLYREWLFSEKLDYKVIELPDSSTWTLRFGKEKEKYIHIHPARYSNHSVRVKSISLKTACLIYLWVKNYGTSPYDLKLINKLRVSYLEASPVKTMSQKNGIGKVISLFVEK